MWLKNSLYRNLRKISQREKIVAMRRGEVLQKGVYPHSTKPHKEQYLVE